MLRNFKIGVRLNLGFGLMILLLCVMGVYGLRQVGTLSNTMGDLYDHSYVLSNAVRDANAHVLRMHAYMKDMCLTDSPQKIDALLVQINENEDTVDSDLKTVEQLSAGNRQDAQTVTAAFDAWRPAHDEVSSLLKTNQREKALSIINGRSSTAVLALEHKMDDLIAKVDQSARSSKSNSVGVTAASHRNASIMMVLMALVGLAVATVMIRSITYPLAAAVSVAEQVAAGNLKVDVPVDNHRDEAALLMRTLGHMVESLQRQIREMLEAVNILVTSATEIAATSTQLASSAAETASSVTETTATVEQVKQTAQMATDKAKDVYSRAQQFVQVSQEGENAVESTLQGIQQIREQMNLVADSVVRLSEQSQTIGEIIESVDDLAEQSNLLAVNAAIEAAKAGEQGKGFAVVAREVKNLAEQSRQATSQVRTILTDIQKATSSAVMATEQSCKSVETGVTQSVQVGESIRTLAQSIDESAQMASDIAASSEQQFSGIDQVTMAMESIKEATSQNVAGARQLEEASGNLSGLGRQLEQLVAHYQV